MGCGAAGPRPHISGGGLQPPPLYALVQYPHVWRHQLMVILALRIM